MKRIRIGTRGSRLALAQAALVQEALVRAADGIETEIVVLQTKGDRVQDKPLSEIGDKGVFSSELGQALAAGKIDAAVHSAKDLPLRLAQGSVIAAVLPRADVRDVLVIPEGGRMPQAAGTDADTASAPEGRAASCGELMPDEAPSLCGEAAQRFRLGTGSRRRRQQAQALWEHVDCADIRGNVDTRLRRLREGHYDGILLAKAGLDRLGIGAQDGGGFIFRPLSPERFLPAACQAIIAVETMRESGAEALCRKISDAETYRCFQVERELLAQLAVECSDAAAAWCRREGEQLALDVMYGSARERFFCRADTEEGLRMARRAAAAVFQGYKMSATK